MLAPGLYQQLASIITGIYGQDAVKTKLTAAQFEIAPDIKRSHSDDFMIAGDESLPSSRPGM